MTERKFIGFMLAWFLVAFLVWFGGRGWAASSDSYVTFDGVDDYASYSGSGISVFNPTRNAVWWGWVKSNVSGGGIFGKWYTPTNKRQWAIYKNATSLAITLSDNGTADAGHQTSMDSSTVDFTVGSWTFWTIEYHYNGDGASGITMFANGSLKKTFAAANGPIHQSDQAIIIGYTDIGFSSDSVSQVGMSTMDVLPETVCGLTGHLWMMANKGKVYPSLQTGTSMYATFGPSKWANGTYAISGVSAASGVTDLLTYTPTTMTQDLDFSGGPKATLWSPRTLYDFATEKWSNWKRFVIP